MSSLFWNRYLEAGK